MLPYYPLAFKGVTVHFVQAFIMEPDALAATGDYAFLEDFIIGADRACVAGPD